MSTTKCLLICEIDREYLWLGEDSICIDLPPDKCSYYKEAVDYVLVHYKDEILKHILNDTTLESAFGEHYKDIQYEIGEAGYFGCSLIINLIVDEHQYVVRRRLEFITRIS